MVTINYTQNIQREIVKLKRDQSEAVRAESQLRADIRPLENKVSAYKNDVRLATEAFKAAETKLQKYTEDFNKAENELKTKQAKLEDISKNLRDLNTQLTKQSAELDRMVREASRTAANTNGAPQQRRASGW